VRLLSIAPGAAAAAVRCDGETAMSVIVGATESQK
jgi:hypothetical protein